MQAIVDRGNAADDAAVALREKQLDLRVGEERILSWVEAIALAETQRRHPARIVRVPRVCVVDEGPEVSATANGANVDHVSVLL